MKLALKGFKEDKMLIGGWVSPPCNSPEGDFLTDETFRLIKESGLNTVYTNGWDLSDWQSVGRASAAAERNGVKINVGAECFRDGRFTEERAHEFIAFCRENAGVGGLNLFDEPFQKDFSTLAELKRKYGGEFEDLLFYVNMLPMYADTAAFGCQQQEKTTTKEKYAAFLEEYLETVRPAFLSYDFYPFRHEKGVCDPDYFVQLSVSIKAAKKYGVPLWNFVQVTSWYREYIRTMTYSEILWQVSTSLAYGVTGIQYFCYWTPIDKGGETFGHAMIAPNGSLTDSWYFVREANRHLKAIEKYILGAKHIGVIAFGDTLVPVPEEDRLKTYGNLEKIDAHGTLIGCFDYEGKNMYYLVNTSLFEERVVKLTFKTELQFRQTRGETNCKFTSKEYAEVLHPGEGILLIEE